MALLTKWRRAKTFCTLGGPLSDRAYPFPTIHTSYGSLFTCDKTIKVFKLPIVYVSLCRFNHFERKAIKVLFANSFSTSL